MNGVELAARYAFAPNCHGYCGTPSFSRVLKSGNTEAMENELKKFRAHYAYLTLIARANALEPFDKKAVEAFWIGNRLLESVSTQSLRRFIARDLHAPKNCAKTFPRARFHTTASTPST